MNKQEIDKAIEILSSFDGTTDQGLQRAVEMAVPLLQRELKALTQQLNNGWIPVSERLPVDRRIVLQVTIKRLKDDYTWVQSLLWDYDKWKWWEESDDKVDEIIFEVTAWQPLPEPYEEGIIWRG